MAVKRYAKDNLSEKSYKDFVKIFAETFEKAWYIVIAHHDSSEYVETQEEQINS